MQDILVYACHGSNDTCYTLNFLFILVCVYNLNFQFILEYVKKFEPLI